MNRQATDYSNSNSGNITVIINGSDIVYRMYVTVRGCFGVKCTGLRESNMRNVYTARQIFESFKFRGSFLSFRFRISTLVSCSMGILPSSSLVAGRISVLEKRDIGDDDR